MSEVKRIEAEAQAGGAAARGVAAGGASVGGPAGVWGWLLQRVTAAALVLVLGVHLWVLHFAGEHAVLTLAGVSVRLRALSYMLTDYTLLGVALYHGLYGLRSVLLDYISGRRAARAVTVGVWVIGVAAFLYGAYALIPFIKG